MPPKKVNYNPSRDARAVLRTRTSRGSPDTVARSGKNVTSAAHPDQQDHQDPPNRGGHVRDYGHIQALIRQEGPERMKYLQNFVGQLLEAAMSTPQPATQMSPMPLLPVRKRQRSPVSTDEDDELSLGEKSKPRRKISRTTRTGHDMADTKRQTANKSYKGGHEAKSQASNPKPTSPNSRTHPSEPPTDSTNTLEEDIKQLKDLLEIANNPQVEPANGTITMLFAGDVYVTLDKPGPKLRVGSEALVCSHVPRTDSEPFNEGDRVKVWFEPSFCDKKVGQVCMVGHSRKKEGEEEEE